MSEVSIRPSPRWRRALPVVLALCGMAVVPARAQQAARYCSASLIEQDSTPTAPRAQLARLRRALKTGDPRALIQPLRAELERIGDSEGTLRRAFLSQFDQFAADLDLIAQAEREKPPVVERRFGASGATGEFDFFVGTADATSVSDRTDTTAARLACHTAYLLDGAAEELNSAAWVLAKVELQDAERRWTQWDKHAWAMFPWEAWAYNLPGVRGCIQTARLGPPRCALALLHPHVGLLAAIARGDGLSVHSVNSRQELVWDVIGFRSYRPSGHAGYGMAVVGVGSSGFGVAVSRERSWQAGLLFFGRRDSADRIRLVISADALRSLVDGSGALERRRAKIADLLRHEPGR